MKHLIVIAAMLAGALPLGAAAADLEVAWLRADTVVTPINASAVDIQAPRRPLGSLWKLFVYSYAVDNNVPTPAYRCAAPLRPGESDCCEPAQSIERDTALLRSCSPFFDPERLHISRLQWRSYWQERIGNDAQWLVDLDHLQPATQTSVHQILHAINAISPAARAAAERALMPMTVSGFAKGKAAPLGGMLRVKTFTWSDPQRSNQLIGGAAGWLVDGTPVWFSASGTSKTVLRTHAQTLADSLPALSPGNEMDSTCVAVDYFDRYPIKRVDTMPNGHPAPPGPLKGTYRVSFESGKVMTFVTTRDLQLDLTDRPLIRGRHTLNDYVARVLDREADPTFTQAARALAVVIRTYTVHNAQFENGCYRIADSTRKQRVGLNDPSAAARAVALFTDGLMLDTPDVRYHGERSSAGVLAWETAVAQDRQGEDYERILAAAWPSAAIAAMSGERDCKRLPDVEAWYTTAVRRWNEQLSGELGFEPLQQPPAICALDSGAPYSDQIRSRIYVRRLKSHNDRITLAHEYLHLAFRYHPRGEDEAFIEYTARKLVE